MKNPKSVGSISTLKFFLDGPVKMEFMNLTVNQLNILVGANGTGKSFINAAMWMMNYIVSAKILSKVHNISFDEIKEAQFAVDGCIGAKDYLTGTMAINYSSSATMDMAVKDGKVLSVTFNCLDDKEEPTKAIYISSNWRRFTEICVYLGMRKECGKTNLDEIVMEMVKELKLYDVLYLESWIAKMPHTLSNHAKAIINNMGLREEEQIESIEVDLDKCDFFAICKDGQKRSMSRWYGSGTQSMVNMIVGQEINS